jgi:pyruvate/2-oxoglutarate/acetoin dehydrogenase E1 component
MLRDENVFIMGEEVGVWGGTYAVTRGFHDEFGERRVRDTPIAEMVIGGAAAGAAMNGLRPVAEFMTINFAFLALDAIVNHAAKVHYMFGGNIKACLNQPFAAMIRSCLSNTPPCIKSEARYRKTKITPCLSGYPM